MIALFDLALALFVLTATVLIYKLITRENKQVEEKNDKSA